MHAWVDFGHDDYYNVLTSMPQLWRVSCLRTIDHSCGSLFWIVMTTVSGLFSENDTSCDVFKL